MRIRLTLNPEGKKAILPINYNYYLTSLIYRFIFSSSKDYSSFLHNQGYRIGKGKKGFKLFTYSMLSGTRYSVKADKIIFENAPIAWEIASPVDIFLQHLISGAFTQGQLINIGNENKGEGMGARFLIERIETIPKPDFKEVMHFTCLSPITISRVYNKAGTFGSDLLTINNSKNNSDNFKNFDEENDICGYDSGHTPETRLGCHYIRPWEDGFSKAIEQNLIKKYKLVHGKDIEGDSTRGGSGNFEILVDKDYMNKKSGKITKKINFKGTEIIGFLSPFEVRGNPKLIEVGYESGFGEKGSIGCGCVRKC